MIEYYISTHKLCINGVEVKGNQYTPYSGHGKGLNNAAMQDAHGVGPIPVGLWKLTAWVNHPHLGKLVTHLLPISVSPDYGRSAFFIHGDNQGRNFTGSDGCIVADYDQRQALQQSGETELRVVA
jgi:hypothetical protein